MNQVGASQKAIIFNKEGRFLTLYRTATAPARPNTWDFPGGDLEFGEDAMNNIFREIKEETGLEVKDLRPFDVESHINNDGDFWITIGYTALAVSEKVTLSFEHNEFKWVTAKEFLGLESAPKLKQFVENLKQNRF
ncbi:MAG: NUDIX hydrolase [bacterium]|nr:NUDIX hydrolase [bacterium]